MYTYEERMRAVKAYIASGYQANKTIQELGYPSHEALRGWYREYQKNGDRACGAGIIHGTGDDSTLTSPGRGHQSPGNDGADAVL